MVDRQHVARAEAAAEKCLVLLKNDEHLLPLKKDARVAVIGEFAARSRYQGAGSSMVNAAQVDDTLPMLDEFFPARVGFAQGFERLDAANDALADEAVQLAKGYEEPETVAFINGVLGSFVRGELAQEAETTAEVLAPAEEGCTEG